MEKQEVVNVRGYKETILIGQHGHSGDAGAFMICDDCMVICPVDNGPNYMTKAQAMKMFNLVEAEDDQV